MIIKENISIISINIYMYDVKFVNIPCLEIIDDQEMQPTLFERRYRTRTY